MSRYLPYHLETDVVVPEAWNQMFTEIKENPESKYTELCEFLFQQQELYKQYSEFFPPKQLVFQAFALTSPEHVKVVILGQDPYHQVGQAMGLSFSVPDGIQIPPSLRNIFKNLQRHVGKAIPKTGDLTGWTTQGVLLLNTALTVQSNRPNSHQQAWKPFTNAIIQWISDHCDKVVFLLWGNHAILKKSFIDENKHLVLTGLHPSPLSNRQGGEHPFLELPHFRICNEYLQSHGKEPIEW